MKKSLFLFVALVLLIPAAAFAEYSLTSTISGDLNTKLSTEGGMKILTTNNLIGTAQVVEVTSTSISLRDLNGAQVTLRLTGSMQLRAGGGGTLQSIQDFGENDKVTVKATKNIDGVWEVKRLTNMSKRRVSYTGIAQKVSGYNFELKRSSTLMYSVKPDVTTLYSFRSGASASATDVGEEDKVKVRGILNTRTKTISTVKSIMIYND